MENNEDKKYTVEEIKELLKNGMKQLNDIKDEKTLKQMLINDFKAYEGYNESDEAHLMSILEPVKEIELDNKGSKIYLYVNIYDNELKRFNLEGHCTLKDNKAYPYIHKGENLKKFLCEEKTKLLEIAKFYHKNLPNPIGINNLEETDKINYKVPIREFTDVVFYPYKPEKVLISDRILVSKISFEEARNTNREEILISSYNIPNNMKRILKQDYKVKNNTKKR